MTNKTKATLLKIGALTLDVGVPLAVTLSYFPLWVQKSSEATVSGLAVVFILLCLIPAMRVIKKRLSSPSAWMIWTFLAVALIMLDSIIDQALVISTFGAIANCIGAALYKIGEKIEQKE